MDTQTVLKIVVGVATCLLLCGLYIWYFKTEPHKEQKKSKDLADALYTHEDVGEISGAMDKFAKVARESSVSVNEIADSLDRKSVV